MFSLNKEETKKTILSFLALFCLLISYYLIKPLRNSQFLNSVDPNFLPFIFLGVAFISLLITKFYSYFYGKLKKTKLIKISYLVMLVILLAYQQLLPSTNNYIVISFYIFASVYFLLALSLMWACINDAFLPKEGQRCYGYVMAGATIGSLAGNEFSAFLVTSTFKDYTLYFATLLMGLALFLVLGLIPQNLNEGNKQTIKKEKPKRNFLSDFLKLFDNRYLKGITLMVYSLALFNTVMEFQLSVRIDTDISYSVYENVFKQHLPELANIGHQKIYTLKHLSEQEKALEIHKLAIITKQSDQEFKKLYLNYLSEKEPAVRKFYIDIFKGQSYLGVILLLITSRFLFSYVGLSFSVLLLPLFCLIAMAIMAYPAEIFIIQSLMIIGGAMNYSLNNATKELLYTQTDEQSKFQLKPLIEGPIMRFGDVSASLLKLFIWFVVAKIFSLSTNTNQYILFAIVTIMVILWAYFIYFPAKDFDLKRKKDRQLASKPKTLF